MGHLWLPLPWSVAQCGKGEQGIALGVEIRSWVVWPPWSDHQHAAVRVKTLAGAGGLCEEGDACLCLEGSCVCHSFVESTYVVILELAACQFKMSWQAHGPLVSFCGCKDAVTWLTFSRAFEHQLAR